MSIVAVDTDCTCNRLDLGVQQCKVHFHVFNNGKRVTSVGSVLRLWPQPPCNACGAVSYRDHREDCPVWAKIQNAQDRGKQTDRLFSLYVNGNLSKIPAGTRRDTVDLFLKLQTWYGKQGFKKAEAQVVLADDEIGGVCDFIFDGVVCDLKSVYDVSDTHLLQVAAYAGLARNVYEGFVLHVTERFKEPKMIPITIRECDDWVTLRSAWRMIQRRTA